MAVLVDPAVRHLDRMRRFDRRCDEQGRQSVGARLRCGCVNPGGQGRDRTGDLPLFRWSCPRMEVVCAGQTGHAPDIQTCWISWSGSLAPSWPHEMTRCSGCQLGKSSATTAVCACASCTILTYRNRMKRLLADLMYTPADEGRYWRPAPLPLLAGAPMGSSCDYDF